MDMIDPNGEKMNTTVQTKFGRASLLPEGYYVIHSRNENRSKALHRLIWEAFYGCKIPEGYVIHHKNGIKTDNCILNLQLMRDSDHKSLHNHGENHPFYGKKMSEETCKKMSDSKTDLLNTTGYFGVTKITEKYSKSGFRWGYHYREDGKRKFMSSVSLGKLKEKVLRKGLRWEEL